MVRMQALDMNPMLGLCPSCKCLVSSQGFVFGPQNADTCVAGVIISEGDIVLPAPQAREGQVMAPRDQSEFPR
jgi:hypothetical protein